MLPSLVCINVIMRLCGVINDWIEQVETNNSQCKHLGEHVSSIVEALKPFSTDPAKLESLNECQDALKFLEACIQEASKKVEEFLNKSRLFRLIHTKKYQREFADINVKLAEAIEKLNLVLHIKQIVDHEEDRQDQAHDLQEILASQGDILDAVTEELENTEELKELQKEWAIAQGKSKEEIVKLIKEQLFGQLGSLKELLVAQQGVMEELKGTSGKNKAEIISFIENEFRAQEERLMGQMQRFEMGVEDNHAVLSYIAEQLKMLSELQQILEGQKGLFALIERLKAAQQENQKEMMCKIQDRLSEQEEHLTEQIQEFRGFHEQSKQQLLQFLTDQLEPLKDLKKILAGQRKLQDLLEKLSSAQAEDQERMRQQITAEFATQRTMLLTMAQSNKTELAQFVEEALKQQLEGFAKMESKNDKILQFIKDQLAQLQVLNSVLEGQKKIQSLMEELRNTQAEDQERMRQQITAEFATQRTMLLTLSQSNKTELLQFVEGKLEQQLKSFEEVVGGNSKAIVELIKGQLDQLRILKLALDRVLEEEQKIQQSIIRLETEQTEHKEEIIESINAGLAAQKIMFLALIRDSKVDVLKFIEEMFKKQLEEFGSARSLQSIEKQLAELNTQIASKEEVIESMHAEFTAQSEMFSTLFRTNKTELAQFMEEALKQQMEGFEKMTGRNSGKIVQLIQEQFAEINSLKLILEKVSSWLRDLKNGQESKQTEIKDMLFDVQKTMLVAMREQRDELLHFMQEALSKQYLELVKNKDEISKFMAVQFDLLLKRVEEKKKQSQEPIASHFRIKYTELPFIRVLAGRVSLRNWKSTKEEVAVKEFGHLTAEEQKLFIRNAQIMIHLHSDFIIELRGVVLEQGRYCLIMPYMPNESLEQLLERKKGHIDPARKLSIALEIAKGLDYLRTEGVIHCNLKTANILLSEEYHVKLTGFQWSKTSFASIQSAAGRDRGQEIVWLAPELFRESNRDWWSDVYNYGTILWELITERKAYQDFRADDLARYLQSGGREKIPEDMPSIYAEIIRSCWEADPAKRQPLGEIIRSLENYRPVTPPEELYERAKAQQKLEHFDEAEKLYDRSARAGFFKAFTGLGGIILATGKNGDDGKRAACEFFKKAGAHQHARAEFNLGEMYRCGDGVGKDLTEALRWYRCAMEHCAMNTKDRQDAEERVDSIVRSLASPKL